MAWYWKPDHNNKENLTAVNLIIDFNLARRIASEIPGLNPDHIELKNTVTDKDAFIGQIALKLKAEAENKTPFGKLFGETAAQLLAIHLLKNYATITPKIPEIKNGLPKTVLKRITDYIHDHLDQDISLEALSILAGLSSYHFARLFKESTGLAPHQYLVECRMEKAKELLKNTRLNVLQIALSVGYESQSHFTTLFKRHTGSTPTAFRKNWE
jgi:AraC family transcriptional regulator